MICKLGLIIAIPLVFSIMTISFVVFGILGALFGEKFYDQWESKL